MSQSLAREGTPYPSQLLENAVEEFAKLPGIGRKTALRLVLHLLRQDSDDINYREVPFYLILNPRRTNRLIFI
jgi:hypothetical protein